MGMGGGFKDGVPTMRPILKPLTSTPPLVDETLLLDEIFDIVPDTIPSQTRGGRKPKLESRHRRHKDASASQLGLKSKKKGSKQSPDRSEASVVESESVTGRMHRRQSTDKKKRRASKEKRGHRRTSDDEGNRDYKPTVVGEEAWADLAVRREEAKPGVSSVDIDGRTVASNSDLPGAAIPVDDLQPLSIDSWRIHFPDETAQIAMKHGNHYEGRISRKLMEGFGIFSWADGAQYHGEFVGGEMTGKGRLIWLDLSWYEGDLVKGWRHGRGLYVSTVKKIAYVGDWVAGFKRGSGIMFYNQEGTDVYDGEWENDLREGYGLRIYPSGARYLGSWRGGLRDGVGTMFFANGDVYAGNWENGLMSGYGEYTWGAFLNHTLSCCGNNVYCGWFECGLRHGKATYELKGGQQIHGEWRTDIKDGRAVLICGDGSAYFGDPMFNDDRPATWKSQVVSENLHESKSESFKLTSAKHSFMPKLSLKSGKFEVRPVQRVRRKTDTMKSICTIQRPSPPESSLILRGYHLPVHAPFQRIDLRHHLALLKSLKHPKESTWCQTDMVLSHVKSITYCEQVESVSESKKSKEKVEEPEMKAKIKIKSSGNEQSTQTETCSLDSLKKASLEMGFPLENKDIAKDVVAKTILKKQPISKEPQKLEPKPSPNVAKNAKKTLPKATKGKVNRRRIESLASPGTAKTSAWPTHRKMLYAGGQTEEDYEEKWLRQTLTRHMPSIRKTYEEYARINCESEGTTWQPFLLRATLWQFYRDCRVTNRVSLVELDRMLASNPLTHVSATHFPFERIQLWQFLYRYSDR